MSRNLRKEEVTSSYNLHDRKIESIPQWTNNYYITKTNWIGVEQPNFTQKWVLCVFCHTHKSVHSKKAWLLGGLLPTMRKKCRRWSINPVEEIHEPIINNCLIAREWLSFMTPLRAPKKPYVLWCQPQPELDGFAKWLPYQFDICILYLYCTHPSYKSCPNYSKRQFTQAILWTLSSGTRQQELKILNQIAWAECQVYWNLTYFNKALTVTFTWNLSWFLEQKLLPLWLNCVVFKTVWKLLKQKRVLVGLRPGCHIHLISASSIFIVTILYIRAVKIILNGNST